MKYLLPLLATIIFSTAAKAQSPGQQEDTHEDRWKESGYYSRNHALFNAIIEMHHHRWNENAGYLVRSAGDTIRPYTRAEWLRDSLALANRNWDNAHDAWPASFSKKEVYDPNKNYKLDSARSNKAGRTQDVKLETTPGETQSLVKDNLQNHSGQDFLFMNNNQLMVSKSGVQTRVLGYVSLPDGTRVIEDGRIMLNNGETMQLKKGEIINLYDKHISIIPVADKE